MAAKTLLIVEDDDDIRTQVAFALSAEGYEVLTAENGLRALETLESLDDASLPVGMILDLMMPEMDGFTLMQKIATEYPRYQKIKIMVATAMGNAVNTDQLRGFAGIIQKPFDLDQLYEIVGKHCG